MPSSAFFIKTSASLFMLHPGSVSTLWTEMFVELLSHNPGSTSISWTKMAAQGVGQIQVFASKRQTQISLCFHLQSANVTV